MFTEDELIGPGNIFLLLIIIFFVFYTVMDCFGQYQFVIVAIAMYKKETTKKQYTH